jgi:hypothetical protein
VRFGVIPVSGEVGRNCIDLVLDPVQSGFNTVQPFPQTGFDPVHLVAQHLVPFNDDIQLVLKILCHDADMMLEVISRCVEVFLENLLNCPDLFCVNKISPQV